MNKAIEIPGEEIARILRLTQFVDHKATDREYRSYRFDVEGDGTTTVTATSQNATARYEFVAPERSRFLPGAFLVPHEQLYRVHQYARFGNIGIEAEANSAGGHNLEITFVNQHGEVNFIHDDSGKLEVFDFQTIPVDNRDSSRFVELYSAELARGVERLASFTSVDDCTNPLHHLYFNPEERNNAYHLVGIADDHGAIGITSLAVAGGYPFETLISPDVLLRSLRVAYGFKPKTMMLVDFDRTGLLKFGPYTVSFFCGRAPFTDQHYTQIYSSVAPAETAPYAVVNTAALLDPLQQKLKASGATTSVTFEFTQFMLKLYEQGHAPCFAALNVDMDVLPNPVNVSLSLGPLVKILESVHAQELVFRFTGPDAPLEIIETYSPSEFSMLVMPTVEDLSFDHIPF